jgi:hypothetical protein
VVLRCLDLVEEVGPELNLPEAHQLEHLVPGGDGGVGEVLVLVLEVCLEGVDAFEPNPAAAQVAALRADVAEPGQRPNQRALSGKKLIRFPDRNAVPG